MKKLLSVALFLLIGVCGVNAQDQTGMIYGNVTNEDGAVLSGAKIIAESTSLIRPFETVTNARGRYVLPVLPIGTYRITASLENYQATALEDIYVSINSRLRIDVQLKTGVVGEDVIVITGEAPLVDIKKTDTGMNISKELFDKLPKGRNFTSIVALAPGATDESDRFGGIMIDGASSSENTFVMDGAATNDIIGGRNRQNAVFEFVEEVQVRSGGYDAEYGGSMGGVVNVVTRSGGNEFSGSLIGYWSSDSLDGDPREALRIDPFNSTAGNPVAEYWQPGKDEYNRFDIGGSIGGYVLRDRVWFFGSYMPYFQDITRTVDFRDGNNSIYETRSFDQDRQRHYATGKLSLQITDKWNASVSTSGDWYKQLGESQPHILPSYNGLSNPDDYQDDLGFRDFSYVVSGRTDYFVNDNLYLSANAGYHNVDTELFQNLYDEAAWIVLRPFTSTVASMIPADRVVPPGSWNYYYFNDNAHVLDTSEQFSSNLQASYFTELAGDHQFKTGFQSNWIHTEQNEGSQNTWYFIYWGTGWRHPITGDVGGNADYGMVRIINHAGRYGVNGDVSTYRYALFLQDSYSPNERLTFNFGIRAEKENLPYFNGFVDDMGRENYVSFDWQDKIAPRIGVSYDVLGDGTLQLFGNFGVYYDVFKLEASVQGQGGFQWVESYRTLTAADVEYWTWPSTTVEAEYPGIPIGPTWDRRFPTPSDPDIEPMGIFEYIAGLNWQFKNDMAVSVRFVHKNLRRAVEDIADPSGADQYIFANPGSEYVRDFYASIGLADIPAVEAVRDYYGVDIRLIKNFSDNWTGGVNLTLSRLRGNYSGLTNTDEGDRDSPNVNRNFDSWWNTFDANWNEVIGILQSDRRYTTTIYGSYLFTDGMFSGLSLGLQQIINDGTPLSSELTLNSIDGYYPYGRGDNGRLDMITRTDIYAEYNLRLADNYTLNLNANITNLFDQDGELNRYRQLNYNSASLTDAELIDMYRSGTPVPVDAILSNVLRDPRYGMTSAFQGARSIRLGAKLTF